MLRHRKAALLAVGALVLLGAAASPNALGNPNHTTILTFSGPVALPGVTLPTGAYMFEIINPGTSGNVVSVTGKDRRHSYYLGFTEQVERRDPSAASVTLGEGRRGEAPPVIAWYPDESSLGHKFIYR